MGAGDWEEGGRGQRGSGERRKGRISREGGGRKSAGGQTGLLGGRKRKPVLFLGPTSIRKGRRKVGEQEEVSLPCRAPRPARKSKSGKGKGALFDIDGDDGSLRSGVSIFGVGGLWEAPCYSERKGEGGTWAVQNTYSGFELEWIEFLAFPETEEQKG